MSMLGRRGDSEVDRPRAAALFGLAVALLVAATPGCGGGDSPAVPGVRVSGSIFAAANSAVDGDVNDPAATYVPNDTVGQAQPIPNPVALGGYVNTPDTGEAGRSRVLGDVRDIYSV